MSHKNMVSTSLTSSVVNNSWLVQQAKAYWFQNVLWVTSPSICQPWQRILVRRAVKHQHCWFRKLSRLKTYLPEFRDIKPQNKESLEDQEFQCSAPVSLPTSCHLKTPSNMNVLTPEQASPSQYLLSLCVVKKCMTWLHSTWLHWI